MGLGAGAGGDLLNNRTNSSFVNYHQNQNFFVFKPSLSCISHYHRQPKPHIYIRLIFTHCGHYENASFLLLDLV